MATGTVKWFNAQKGYGFIQPESGSKDVFVHISAVERAGLSTLKEGQKISFDTERDQRSGKEFGDQSQGQLRSLRSLATDPRRVAAPGGDFLYPASAAVTAATARRLRAAMVSVGLAVVEVGKTDDPRMNRFPWSWLRRSRSTTEVLGSLPIRAVPMIWPAPCASGLCWTSAGPEPGEDLAMGFAGGGEPRLHIIVQAIGQARQRHAIDILRLRDPR